MKNVFVAGGHARIARGLAALILLSWQCAGAETPSVPAPFVEPAQWMLALADDFFVPGYAALAGDARNLQEATVALCAAPTNAALAETQRRWRTLARQWRRLEALPIGPVLERRSRRRFDFWPTRPAQVDEAIAAAPASVAALKTIGVSAQGLPALEYILFDGKRTPVSDAGRCRYALVLTQAIREETDALAPAWRAWREQWTAEDLPKKTADAALTEALNATVGAVEQLRLRKLEKPSRSRSRGEPLFDAWRSGATRAHLQATFEGVRVVLFGGRSGVGLNAMLRGYGHLTLADRIDAEARAIDAALQALPVKLTAPSAAAPLARATTAVARLQKTLSVDVAHVLKVTIGFNESDGD